MDPTPKDLRTFGITMAIMLTLISGIFVWRGHWIVVYALWIIAGLNFLIPALLFPKGLRPVFRVWMKFAFALGWLNSRIILSLCYYLMFTPISIVQRLIGRDALEYRKKEEKDSYWHDRSSEEYNPKHFEKQF